MPNFNVRKVRKCIQLFDPHFNKPNSIDCLLRPDIYSSAMLPKIFNLKSSGISKKATYQKTKFGWVAYGKANFKNNGKTCSITCIDNTFMNIPKLWEYTAQKSFFE